MSDADVVSLMYQYVDNMAFLLLAALGLIIILGVVNVINLAHGELIMLGAYSRPSLTIAPIFHCRFA